MNLAFWLLLVLVAAAAILEVWARLLQFSGAIGSLVRRRAPTSTFQATDAGRSPFVSVHVPTHNEPAGLVIDTLNALAASDLADFEVVVIDNNTPDPATWAPVKAACETLGPRFRFLHVEGLAGAKAGALNVALEAVDPRTTHVAVVDADYQVDPDFLADGLAALSGARADYVQFPQAYRGVTASARGVEHELADYFACFQGGAGRAGSMLPTGTLSLFTADALRAVGGWPTQTITEDAEIGVRLQRAGYRGLWLARERGRGLLPLDFRSLQVQRARWAAGNLQVWLDLCRRRWAGLKPAEFVNLTVQLTAWLSLWLPLAGALALAALAPALPYAGDMARIAAAAILLSAGLTATRMLASSSLRRVGWDARAGAVVSKIALAWTSATAWLPALALRPLAFKRTRKLPDAAGGDGLAGLAAVSIAFLALGVLYALRGQGLEAAACALLGSAWPCARAVDAGLRAASNANPELVAGVRG